MATSFPIRKTKTSGLHGGKFSSLQIQQFLRIYSSSDGLGFERNFQFESYFSEKVVCATWQGLEEHTDSLLES